jgi:hypothetical protein
VKINQFASAKSPIEWMRTAHPTQLSEKRPQRRHLLGDRMLQPERFATEKVTTNEMSIGERVDEKNNRK